ncbi:hypothetical protein Tco_0321502 [Tanacetum coccineum]
MTKKKSCLPRLGSSTHRTTISEKTNGVKSIGTRLLKISTTKQQVRQIVKAGENEADLIETVKTVYLERKSTGRSGKGLGYQEVLKRFVEVIMIDTSYLPPHKRALLKGNKQLNNEEIF